MKSRMKDTLLLVGDTQSDRAELHNIFESLYNLLEAENLPALPELAAQIVLALEEMYRDFPHNRPEYLEQYRAGCITTGKQVQLITPAAPTAKTNAPSSTRPASARMRSCSPAARYSAISGISSPDTDPSRASGKSNTGIAMLCIVP